jgi:hypothetical protein
MMLHLVLVLLTPVLSSAAASAESASSLSSSQSSYDDLVRCMWNGTNVGNCHSLNCLWCHSNFVDICVSHPYAKSLNGTIFHCERGGHSSQDDDDLTSSPTPSPTDSNDDTPPETDDEIPTPSPKKDDDSPKTNDDDDPNHDANEAYMKRLLHCLKIPGGPTECSNDALCTWCETSSEQQGLQGVVDPGICLSHRAAENMNGPYYHCQETTMELPTSNEDLFSTFSRWIRMTK